MGQKKYEWELKHLSYSNNRKLKIINNQHET